LYSTRNITKHDEMHGSCNWQPTHNIGLRAWKSDTT